MFVIVIFYGFCCCCCSVVVFCYVFLLTWMAALASLTPFMWQITLRRLKQGHILPSTLERNKQCQTLAGQNAFSWYEKCLRAMKWLPCSNRAVLLVGVFVLRSWLVQRKAIPKSACVTFTMNEKFCVFVS